MMHLLSSALLLLSVGSYSVNAQLQSTTTAVTCHNAVPYAQLPLGYCASFYARGVGRPRGLYYDAATNWLLTVSSTDNVIYAVKDVNNDGIVNGTSEILKVATAPLINHGIDRLGNYLYASSQSTIYRWRYSSNSTSVTLGSREAVVSAIPTASYGTRTLKFDAAKQYLYVSVGSLADVDLQYYSNRAQIKRFSTALFNQTIPAGGYDYSTNGTVFAKGLRNEVAIGFDSYGQLWGGSQGSDGLNRKGTDISAGNPAEQISLFLQANSNKTYGYPQCYLSNSTYGNQQYAMPLPYPNAANGLPPYGTVLNTTDAFCRDSSQVVQPKLALPAHSAPLGLVFYPNISTTNTSFPSQTGNMFITAHGFWTLQPPAGDEIYVVAVNQSNPQQLISYSSFFRYASSTASNSASQWPYRPVDVTVDNTGALLVSSDLTGDILRISYVGNNFNATAQLAEGNTGIFQRGTLTGMAPSAARQRLFPKLRA